MRVKLTEEGQQQGARPSSHLWDEVEAELLDGFDARERKRLRKLLRRAAKNLAEVTGADPEAFDAVDEEIDELDEVMPVRIASA